MITDDTKCLVFFLLFFFLVVLAGILESIVDSSTIEVPYQERVLTIGWKEGKRVVLGERPQD